MDDGRISPALTEAEWNRHGAWVMSLPKEERIRQMFVKPSSRPASPESPQDL
jgi:hypothetical protein